MFSWDLTALIYCRFDHGRTTFAFDHFNAARQTLTRTEQGLTPRGVRGGSADADPAPAAASAGRWRVGAAAAAGAEIKYLEKYDVSRCNDCFKRKKTPQNGNPVSFSLILGRAE